MSKSPRSPVKVWMFIPGTLFWVLAGVGIATENTILLGVAVIFALATVAVGLALKGSKSARQQKRRAAVWTDGEPARAIVKRIRKRGGFNDHPQVEFELEIILDDGSRYPAQTTALISQLAVPRVQPEMVIAARVDRADRAFVVLDEALTPYGYA